ncbi:unnamed protein product [Rangifer tarandus platyrhynchus]|uniref:Uncharacterized protein n=2 Tax=Rangifer tarandus platyrhynchus TaxID=3082113 RepID=A0AC59Z7L8_RANTA|nr:unnamed protein product [Rangifer tarandus platyrhynchus]
MASRVNKKSLFSISVSARLAPGICRAGDGSSVYSLALLSVPEMTGLLPDSLPNTFHGQLSSAGGAVEGRDGERHRFRVLLLERSNHPTISFPKI